MGIRNLSSFITDCCHLRHPHKLMNTYVVIDGSNLSHTLYERYCHQNPSDYLFGGNYTEYRKLFKTFFENLDKCKITPIVVFDGGSNPQLKDDRKHRFEEKFNKSKQLSKSPPMIPLKKVSKEDIISPKLLKKCFKSAAEELKVICFKTKLDADRDLAQLANHLNCVLISNDSDFALMDINMGVVACDSLEWQNPIQLNNSKKYYIKCQVYKVRDLVQLFNERQICLKAEVLPIFGSILGNDGIDGQIFDELFEEISSHVEEIIKTLDLITAPYKASQYFRHKRWRRMEILLFWLSNHFYERREAIVYIEDYLKRKQFDLNIFRVSIKSFETNGKSYLKELLDHKLAKTRENDIPIEEIVAEYRLPKWFLIDYFCNAKLNSMFLTFIGHKIANKSPLIEDFTQESTIASCCQLYGFILGLLRINRNDRTPLWLTLRVGNDFQEIKIEPKTHISGGGDQELPILPQLRELCLKHRKKLIFDILGFDDKWMSRLESDLLSLKFEAKEIEFWQYFVFISKCWKLNSKLKELVFEFIRAIVLSVIYYKHTKSVTRSDFDGLKVEAKGVKDWRIPEERFKPLITHYYCEFISIYSVLNSLVALLGQPISSAKLHRYLNGLLYYNLFNEITNNRLNSNAFESHRLNSLSRFVIYSING